MVRQASLSGRAPVIPVIHTWGQHSNSPPPHHFSDLSTASFTAPTQLTALPPQKEGDARTRQDSYGLISATGNDCVIRFESTCEKRSCLYFWSRSLSRIFERNERVVRDRRASTSRVHARACAL